MFYLDNCIWKMPLFFFGCGMFWWTMRSASFLSLKLIKWNIKVRLGSVQSKDQRLRVLSSNFSWWLNKIPCRISKKVLSENLAAARCSHLLAMLVQANGELNQFSQNHMQAVPLSSVSCSKILRVRISNRAVWMDSCFILTEMVCPLDSFWRAAAKTTTQRGRTLSG